MRSIASVIALAAAIFVTAPPAWTQSLSSGTIHGIVKDETGGALPGVTVTLTSPALQVRQVTNVTGAEGAYRFVDLPAGVYSARFELPGIQGQRTYVFRAVDPDGGPRLQQLGTVTMRMEPYGSQKGPAISIVNLRVGKRFSLWGAQRFDVDFDLYNLLNSSAATSMTFVAGPTFGYATRVVPARVARIGAKYSF